nr:MAG TPA: protein of unknown function (DUF3846) [Caudoviricetes sp.]
MNRTELIGYLQSKYAMTAEEVEKIENDGEKLIKAAFDFAGFKPDVDIRELVDGAFGGNLSNRDYLEEGSSAVRIRVDGVVENITPMNGSDFSLEEMYKLIGQDIIDFVYLPNDKLFVVDDEGFYRVPLNINWIATRILSELYLMVNQRPAFIFGDVLLVNSKQVK